MSSFRNSSGLRIFVGLLASIAVFTYCTRRSTEAAVPGASLHMADRAALGPVAGLDVSLKQTSTSPPTIVVAVSNKNSEPVTVLTYGSALDPMALQTGLLSITPAGAHEPLGFPTVQVRRLWPPPAEALVGIAPGETVENEIEIKERVVPFDKIGEKATVQLKGRWGAVWAKGKDNVNAEALKDGPSGEDVSKGEFVTDPLEITIS